MNEKSEEKKKKYVTQFNYELAGTAINLVMDDGYEYVADFLTGEIMMWSKRGEPVKWEKYKCLKADETTYFVVSELYGRPLRTCMTLVLDMENSLATMHTARQGGMPGRPRMVQVEITFGAIKQQGKELEFKRHSFTSELVGKKITWTYSSGFVNAHIYISENYYRAWAFERPPLPEDATPEQIAQRKRNDERDAKWLYEEPFRCVKIKDGMYLGSGIEENMNKIDNMVGGNNLLFLTNMKGGYDVGRTFCLNAKQEPESGLFSSHGVYCDEYIEAEHLPSPYRI